VKSLKNAILRVPSANFDQGLSSSRLGPPDFDRAVAQHSAYRTALKQCGLTLTVLEEDSRHPDSVFVEDTAVLTSKCAVITRPGAPSRLGEIASIGSILRRFYSSIHSISEPGTLDGGDVCEVEDHFLIGISARTNEAGAQQLAEILRAVGYSSSLIDIRNLKQVLHLKSGIAYLGDHRLAVIDALADCDEFRDDELIRIEAGEEYAANCLRINGQVLLATGHPLFERRLRELGYETIGLSMTEFEKMDGGLSCLSLRF
jgi:dimethylargininase